MGAETGFTGSGSPIRMQPGLACSTRNADGVIILATAMLLIRMRRYWQKQHNFHNFFFYLVHTTLSNCNRVTRISAHTFGKQDVAKSFAH